MTLLLSVSRHWTSSSKTYLMNEAHQRRPVFKCCCPALLGETVVCLLLCWWPWLQAASPLWSLLPMWLRGSRGEGESSYTAFSFEMLLFISKDKCVVWMQTNGIFKDNVIFYFMCVKNYSLGQSTKAEWITVKPLWVVMLSFQRSKNRRVEFGGL